LLTASLTDGRTRAAVPAPLVRATVQAAMNSGAAAALVVSGMRMVTIVLVVSVLLAVAVWPTPRAAQTTTPATPPVQAHIEEQERIAITGQVIGEDDKPLAAARVAVVASGNGPAASRDVSSIGFGVFGQTTADAEGKFRLTLSRSSLGEAILMARKDGYGVSQQALNVEVERHKVTIRLAREQVVRGRLLDLQGEPAAGVKLLVGHIGKRATGAFFSVHPESLVGWPSPVTTDGNGRFLLHGVARGQEAELLVRDDRFAWQMLRYIAEPGGTETPRTLSPGRRLEGRVLYDDTGKPAVGTVVVLMPPAIASTANKDGRFSLNLPP